jgi:hypothetical protein
MEMNLGARWDAKETGESKQQIDEKKRRSERRIQRTTAYESGRGRY